MAAIQSLDLGLVAVGDSKKLGDVIYLYWVSFSCYLVEPQNA